jgi:hypothetical protein
MSSHRNANLLQEPPWVVPSNIDRERAVLPPFIPKNHASAELIPQRPRSSIPSYSFHSNGIDKVSLDSTNENDSKPAARRVLQWPGSATDGCSHTAPKPVIDLTGSESESSTQKPVFSMKNPIIDLSDSDSDDSFFMLAFAEPYPLFTRRHSVVTEEMQSVEEQNADKRRRDDESTNESAHRSRKSLKQLWFWKKHSLYDCNESDSSSVNSS